jgi:hypothetical protein
MGGAGAAAGVDGDGVGSVDERETGGGAAGSDSVEGEVPLKSHDIEFGIANARFDSKIDRHWRIVSVLAG